jgi:uncharacterized spore protein YtfJ
METTDIRVDNPIVLDGLTIIPVVEVSLHYWQLAPLVSVCGMKTPIAFIIVSPAGKRAYWASGEEVSIDELIDAAPDLIEVWERFSPS